KERSSSGTQPCEPFHGTTGTNDRGSAHQVRGARSVEAVSLLSILRPPNSASKSDGTERTRDVEPIRTPSVILRLPDKGSRRTSTQAAPPSHAEKNARSGVSL